MSDIARQYAAASLPGLYSGTTASNTAGAGTVKKNGSELATVKNGDLAHDYKDDRTK